jgi:hypothetical protein
MPMGAIQVKDVPEELHEALRRRPTQEGMTMADDVLDLIRRDLGLPSRRECWSGSRPEPVNLGPDAVVEALHAARAEGDAHIAAALGRRDTEVDDAGRD